MAVRFCFAFTRDIGEEALETLSSIPCLARANYHPSQTPRLSQHSSAGGGT
jgi:hypothetical protein